MSKGSFLLKDQRNSSDDKITISPSCWIILSFLILFLLLAMGVTTGLVLYTHSLLTLSVFAPLAYPAYLLYRILQPLLPINEKKFQLEKAKILLLPTVTQLTFKDKGMEKVRDVDK